ncbi:MAG: hypothetical protein S4CHLAM2_16220 [Chlamydiales bacterium]|nr:hypothetical protein [Chlamydiales bacterium]
MSSSITESAPNICFTIRHSETFGSLKQSVLLTTLALAIITTVGAILGVLALQGFNLGGINALTNFIGYKGVYLALITGCSVLLIDTVLIVSLLRSSSKKQLSQREVDALNLDADSILKLLEPGQYGDFPNEFLTPVNPTETAPGEEAVFGIVVKDGDELAEIYAYRSAENLLAKKVELRALGFVNGEKETYPAEFVDARQLKFPELCVGQYAAIDLTRSDEPTVFALKRKLSTGVEQLLLCKSERARAERAKGFFWKVETIDADIKAHAPAYASYVPAERLWPLPAQDYHGRTYYPFCYKEAGIVNFAYCWSLEGDSGVLSDGTVMHHLDVDDGSQLDCLHFKSVEARRQFVEEWRCTPVDAFPPAYVEGQIPLDLMNYPVKDFEFIAYEFTLRNGTEVFYFKGGLEGETTTIFFKSQAERSAYINQLSEQYVDIGLVNDRICEIAESEKLKVKLTNNNVYWSTQIPHRGQTLHVLIFKSSLQYFRTFEEGRAWLRQRPQLRCLNHDSK